MEKESPKYTSKVTLTVGGEDKIKFKNLIEPIKVIISISMELLIRETHKKYEANS